MVDADERQEEEKEEEVEVGLRTRMIFRFDTFVLLLFTAILLQFSKWVLQTETYFTESMFRSVWQHSSIFYIVATNLLIFPSVLPEEDGELSSKSAINKFPDESTGQNLKIDWFLIDVQNQKGTGIVPIKPPNRSEDLLDELD